MKKFALTLVTVLFATAAFAQDFSAGLRVGSGVQAVGQYCYNGENYLEARFGASWNNFIVVTPKTTGSRLMAEFTLLHNWHILDMDWTPSYGEWFFDAGVGVSAGGREYFAYAGINGMARLGFKFFDAPVTIALDWSPTIGPAIAYGKYMVGNEVIGRYNNVVFNELGLANIGISCVFNF